MKYFIISNINEFLIIHIIRVTILGLHKNLTLNIL